MKKDEIKIKSSLHTELSFSLVIGRDEYLIHTENGGLKDPFVITRIYNKGRIISTRKTAYKIMAGMPAMIDEIMQKQHQLTITMFKAEKMKEAKTPSDYLEDAKNLLIRKKYKNALEVMFGSLAQYPDNPFLLSYYGCLDAIVNKNYKSGIDTCKMAIELLKNKMPFGEEFFYPVFYLNLGRAYLAAGRKKYALDTFIKGINMDSENTDLLMELRGLGIRKKPAVSFLKRSNPINKCIGILLRKLYK